MKPSPPAPKPLNWVTLVAREPDWGVLFWGVGSDRILRARDTLGAEGTGAELVLRTYSRVAGSSAPPGVREQPLPLWTGHKPLLLMPGRLHRCVLGMRGTRGTFVPLCRSGAVQAPASQPLTSPHDVFRQVEFSKDGFRLRDVSELDPEAHPDASQPLPFDDLANTHHFGEDGA